MSGYESPAAAYSNALEAQMLQREKSAMDAAKLDLDRQRHEADMQDREEERQFRREVLVAKRQERIETAAEKKAAAGNVVEEKERAATANMLAGQAAGDVMMPDDVQRVQKHFPSRLQNPKQGLRDFADTLPPGSPLRFGVTAQAETPPMADMAAQGVPMHRTMTPPEQVKHKESQQEDAYIASLEEGPLKAAAVYQQRTGKAAPVGVINPKPTTKPVYRTSADGRTVTHVGDVPADVVMVREPQPRVSAGGGEGDVSNASPAAIDMWAIAVAKGGSLPALGNGKQAAALKTLIGNRAAQYDVDAGVFRETGNTTPDLVSGGANIAATRAALTQLQKNLSAVGAFSGAAQKNGALLQATLGKLPDSGVTILNQPYRALATMFGSETMAQFAVLRQSVQTEYARAINNPNLTGVLTNEARKEIEAGLAPNATVGQFKAALATFAAEAANRESSIKDEMALLRASLKGGGDSGGKGGGPGAGGGKVEVKSPKNGKVYTFANQAEADAMIAKAKAAGAWE